MKRWTVSMLVFCLLLGSAGCATQRRAHKATANEIICDFAVVRPTYLVSTIIGAGWFVATLPFNICGNNVPQAGKVLVANPARATVANTLGDPEAMALWPFKYDEPNR